VVDPFIAAATAVGLAIAAMYYLHCIHPPGGATALVAVLGGSQVEALGYQFLLTPVLENLLVMLLVAVVLNAPFQWRRYPVTLARYGEERIPLDGEEPMIAHSDLVYALSQLDSFIDVSEQDLIRIYTLAVRHTHSPVPCHQQGRVCGADEGACICRRYLAGNQVEMPEPS